MSNRYEGHCYRCGREVGKGKGFAEGTHKHHREMGITARTVIRCKQCHKKQFMNGNAEKLIRTLVNNNLHPSEWEATIYFDNIGRGHIRIAATPKGCPKPVMLITSITSRQPSEGEIAVKQAALGARIARIQERIQQINTGT